MISNDNLKLFSLKNTLKFFEANNFKKTISKINRFCSILKVFEIIQQIFNRLSISWVHILFFFWCLCCDGL